MMIDLPSAALGSERPRGHLAVPPGEGPWPGVVLVHEAFGLDDEMIAQADRMAARGFLTVAPDLYSDGGARRCLVSTLLAWRKGSGKAFIDLEVAREFLVARPDCTGKVGILGFCMGGGFALLVANRDGWDVAAVNYGMEPPSLDAVLDGACPIVASYPGRDRMLRGVAAELEAAADRHGVPHDVKEYPAAGHSFLNETENAPRPLRPILRRMGTGPEPEAAADAWTRIEAFFAEHLA